MALVRSKILKVTCGCHLYLSNGAGDGVNEYGGAEYKGKTINAHRVAWIEKFGEIPDNLCVLHKKEAIFHVNK